ncbi:hypothetical protein DFR24_1024 [Panacagrimonas perspica]|uniref:Uncharacterized protein n=1 Tax=Panacagrimonas perspica TaxID=381431 RepID=A0A4R7PCA3_9GAMM|nr:hypothetical protein [Panacagrimonas perspica]TDU31648.1 hypothetical protein DFR24_1024 [Panacagrimonas perspica]
MPEVAERSRVVVVPPVATEPDMPDPKKSPLRIFELWLALAIPVATVIALIGYLHVASKSGFTEIAEPAATPP